MTRFTLLLIVTVSMAGTAWSQQTGSTQASHSNFPLGAPSAGTNQIVITPDEWKELRVARSAALQTNPDLVAENKKLMERMSNFEDKLDAAMVKADPTIAPIIAKFEPNRPHPATLIGSAPAAQPPSK